jgi:hypothetical protein
MPSTTLRMRESANPAATSGLLTSEKVVNKRARHARIRETNAKDEKLACTLRLGFLSDLRELAERRER